MILTWDIAIKLLISILVGGIIGAEREYHNRTAGLRTMMLICLGSTLFTLFSLEIGEGSSPDRIASNIVTGIGFVGAGVIFMGGAGIQGVTTAATIWATAALGMGVGAGFEYIALAGCIVLVGILYLFTIIEEWINRLNRGHTYKIICPYRNHILEDYEALMKQYHLSFKRGTQYRNEDTICSVWQTEGSRESHNKFIQHVLNDQGVKRFEF